MLLKRRFSRRRRMTREEKAKVWIYTHTHISLFGSVDVTAVAAKLAHEHSSYHISCVGIRSGFVCLRISSLRQIRLYMMSELSFTSTSFTYGHTAIEP